MIDQLVADASTRRDEATCSDVADSQTEILFAAQKQALEMVVRGAPLGDVLRFLTRIVEQSAGSEVVASILLLDEQGCLRIGAAPSLPDHYLEAIDGLKALPDIGTCSAAAATGRIVITPDFDAAPQWQALKHLPLAIGLKAAWTQPVVARDGRVLGTFGTYFRTCRGPSALELELVGSLSHTAAIAIERKQLDRRLEEQHRVFELALEAADMGTWRYSVSDGICEYSPRAQELYGLSAPRLRHDEEGLRDIVDPADIPGIWRALQSACDPAGDGRYRVDCRVRRRGGGWRWLSVWGLAEFEGEAGRRHAVAVIGASRDITNRKESERRQGLLVDELNHRVKNTLAIVQSMAAQTLRETPEPSGFKEAFSARVAALARAHSLLTGAQWQGASLRDIAAATLAPFGGHRPRNAIRCDGPQITISPNAAVTLCLVLHELATNATKYGALTTPRGHVALTWSSGAAEGEKPAMVQLCWREHDGPAVEQPAKAGFGSRLIDASAVQLGGRCALTFEAQGVECLFSFPRLDNCIDA